MNPHHHALAKDAAERAAKNASVAPELLFAPILWAIQDAALAPADQPLPAGREEFAQAVGELRTLTHKLLAGHPGLETPEENVSWLDEGLYEIARKLAALSTLARPAAPAEDVPAERERIKAIVEEHSSAIWHAGYSEGRALGSGEDFDREPQIKARSAKAALTDAILAALSPATGRAEGEEAQGVVLRTLSPEEAQARYQALVDAQWRERLAESRALPIRGAGHD